jgi:hypothetical protein
MDNTNKEISTQSSIESSVLSLFVKPWNENPPCSNHYQNIYNKSYKDFFFQMTFSWTNILIWFRKGRQGQIYLFIIMKVSELYPIY